MHDKTKSQIICLAKKKKKKKKKDISHITSSLWNGHKNKS